MKFKYIIISFLIVTVGVLALGVTNRIYASSTTTICTDSAVAGSNGAGTDLSSSAFCKDQSKNPSNPLFGKGGVLNGTINIITAIAGFVAVIMIIISGLQMINSGGNSEKISNARNTIIYASVGLVVIALARIIIAFIINKAS